MQNEPQYDVLVMGIGNILWADEGFGVRAVERFHEKFADDPCVRVIDGGTLGAYLINEVINARNRIVCPGFIDIQINGAFGYDFSDPSITKEQINHVCRNLLSSGCTAICPTIITSAFDTYHRNLQLFAYREGSVEEGCAILGAHCEGPFISPQRSGAHPPEYVRAPVKGAESVRECYGNTSNIKIVTMAPELEGALDATKYLVEQGITVSMGHTAAHINQAIDGVGAGASLMTHLFNAMTPFHHRDPGMIGVLGMPTDESPYYSIIVDGIHSHPFAVRFAWKANGSHCVLITDAMAAAPGAVCQTLYPDGLWPPGLEFFCEF